MAHRFTPSYRDGYLLHLPFARHRHCRCSWYGYFDWRCHHWWSGRRNTRTLCQVLDQVDSSCGCCYGGNSHRFLASSCGCQLFCRWSGCSRFRQHEQLGCGHGYPACLSSLSDFCQGFPPLSFCIGRIAGGLCAGALHGNGRL